MDLFYNSKVNIVNIVNIIVIKLYNLSMIRVLRKSFCNIAPKFSIPSRIGGSSSEDLFTIYAGKYKN